MTAPKHVILLHGLWMRSFSLRPLATHLQRHGFHTTLLDYASCTRSVDHAVQTLIHKLQSVPQPCHLVGHSLGGMISVMAAMHPDAQPHIHRIACIASPLNGASIAGAIRQWPRPLRMVIGKNVDRLHRPGLHIPANIDVGNIAGTQPVGLGRLIARYDDTCDGTVTVTETRHPQLADHICIHSSHTRLLWNTEVFRQTQHFLEHGQFQHSKMAGA